MSNLPCGVLESDIPGNQDIDIAYEYYFDNAMEQEVCARCDEEKVCHHHRNGQEYDCFEVAYDFDIWYNDKQYFDSEREE
jgi:hypothetical protein